VKANTKEAFDFFWSQDRYVARHYLEASRLSLYELVAQYCADTLSNYDVPMAVRIVDIGCGCGQMLESLRCKLAARHKLELHGLDFSSAAVIRARRLLPMVTFMVEDIYNNSLPSDFFDLVLCIETLEHLRWPEKALLELLRVCRLGGSIVITVPNGEKDSWDGHVNFWNMSQLSKLLHPYGLVDIKAVQDDAFIMARLVKRTSVRRSGE
jgi:2-polyprenyl-3-methyl-5-hydroxy-6-metoxy-1,4-benzoquinol methylase